MRNGFRVLLGLMLLTASPVVAAERSFLCIGDLSTGFRFDGTRWNTTTFNVENDKFAVTIDGLDVKVTRIGHDYPLHECSLYALDAEQFACGGLGYGFVMNFTSLRFQEFYGIGYVDGKDQDPDTPAIGIGKCSPL